MRAVTNFKIDPYLNADSIGHLTTEIWWSMIEMSISVVAACLPTLRPIFGKLSPERIVQSIRSMFSLQSLNSLTSSAHKRRAGSVEDSSENNSRYIQFPDDQASKEHYHQNPSAHINTVESIRLRDLEAQKNLGSMPILATTAR